MDITLYVKSIGTKIKTNWITDHRLEALTLMNYDHLNGWIVPKLWTGI